jgi:hypothetical protein
VQALAAELEADNRQLSEALGEREQQALGLAQKQRELRQQLHDARRALQAQGLGPERSEDDPGGLAAGSCGVAGPRLRGWANQLGVLDGASRCEPDDPLRLPAAAGLAGDVRKRSSWPSQAGPAAVRRQGPLATDLLPPLPRRAAPRRASQPAGQPDPGAAVQHPATQAQTSVG